MTLGYNADGVISEGVLHEPGYDDENIGEGGEAMFGTEENDQLNVDVNMLFLWGLYSNYDSYEGHDNYVSTDTVIMGRLDRLGFLRLLGKGADKYVIYGGEYDAVASADHMPYSDQEPGTVYPVEGERTTTVDDEADSQLSYEFGADKSITSISYTQMWVKVEYTRWYEVTNEVIEERPDGTKLYYAKELPDRYTEEEVDRAPATYIFRFEYK